MGRRAPQLATVRRVSKLVSEQDSKSRTIVVNSVWLAGVVPMMSLHNLSSCPRSPTGYRSAMRFQYPKVKLQIAALVTLLGITPLLLLLASLLQGQSIGRVIANIDRTRDLAVVIVTVLATMVIHELIHGMAYRLLGYRVTYGVSVHLFAAYAGALEQWQKRDHNVIAALAPLIALTVMLVPMLAVPNRIVVLVGLSALLMNTAGAVGDLYLVWRLMQLPQATLLYDVDEKTMLVYVPAVEE
jgi:hypothetical protein